jgi:hypothetical protein
MSYKKLTDSEYKEKIHEYFGMIGEDYDHSITMIYTTKNPSASNSVNSNEELEQEFEEPEDTFSSMNFVWKIIWEIPPNMFPFMTRPEKIRFVRVAKQRILKTLNTHIDFVSKDLGATNIESKKLAAMQRASLNDTEFKNILSNKIDKLVSDNKITDKELYEDNDSLLQTYIDRPKTLKPLLPTPKGKKVAKTAVKPKNVVVALNAKPKPKPKPRVAKSRTSKAKNVVVPVNRLYGIRQDFIMEFRIEMDEIDDADKLLHNKEDTPEILSKIDAFKNEYLNKFTSELNSEDDDTQYSELRTKQLHLFAERLQDIRKEAYPVYNPQIQVGETRIEMRKKREKKKKELIANSKIQKNVVNPLIPLHPVPLHPVPLHPVPLHPVPRGKKVPKTNATKNAAKPRGKVNATMRAPNVKNLKNYQPTLFTPTNENKPYLEKKKKIEQAAANIRNKELKNAHGKRGVMSKSLSNKAQGLPVPRGKKVNAPKTAKKTAQNSKTNQYANKVNELFQTLNLSKLSGPKKSTAKLTPKYLKVKL